jgi:hypothetical protein
MHSHFMHTFHPTHARISHANSMNHYTWIQTAITDLESQERVNYKITIKNKK